MPESVKSLSLSNRSTEDLQVTWSKAEGDVDKYEIQLLFNDMKVFPPILLGNTIEEYQFMALTPGRLYKIFVSTISGNAQCSTFIEGLTSKKKMQQLKPALWLFHSMTREKNWKFRKSRLGPKLLEPYYTVKPAVILTFLLT